MQLQCTAAFGRQRFSILAERHKFDRVWPERLISYRDNGTLLRSMDGPAGWVCDGATSAGMLLLSDAEPEPRKRPLRIFLGRENRLRLLRLPNSPRVSAATGVRPKACKEPHNKATTVSFVPSRSSAP